MISIKRMLKNIALYLVCLVATTGGVYAIITFSGEKTLHFDKKQWHPAEPETQHIDPTRLTHALDYVDKRLPTARSLMLLRNGKTVVEKYYWHGGPKKTDYLHSLNLPLLQVLIGIAIDQKLIRGPEQPLSAFFPEHLTQTLSDGTASLTLNHLLRAQAPLLWGARNPDYWALFYTADRIEASLRVISRRQAGTQPSLNFAAAYLLSRVIEQVSGRSVFNFADRYLFQPLGITTYAADDDDLPRDPMVGFQLKALDLAKIGYLLAREGAWDGRQIVAKQWVRRLLFKAPHAELDDTPGGNWAKTTIKGHASLVVRGDGGQYIVLVPALHVVVVTTSTSRFALPQDNGHDRLLQLIIEAVLETPDTAAKVAEPGLKSEAQSGHSTDILEPNYVFATSVPPDLLDFFNQFAQDIATKDIRRIAENYARGYEHGGDTFASLPRRWRRMFNGGPGHLEYVHITKIRIENNRAYLRGSLKYAYANMVAGSIGLFPLENLIKLKGRWRWLGLPEKTALLDRDDYFDAELSEEHQRFVDDCSGPLVGESQLFETDCFAETFQLAGGGRELLAERLQPFLRGRSGGDLHVTGVQPNGAAYRVQGYIEGSALGELRLPDGLHIVKENGAWKWQGIVDSKQTE
jgi:CubicO group peptidase (beta-lactamase class C family)